MSRVSSRSDVDRVQRRQLIRESSVSSYSVAGSESELSLQNTKVEELLDRVGKLEKKIEGTQLKLESLEEFLGTCKDVCEKIKPIECGDAPKSVSQS